MARYQRWERMFQAGEAKAQAQRSDTACGLGNHKQLSIVSSAKHHIWRQERWDTFMSLLKTLVCHKALCDLLPLIPRLSALVTSPLLRTLAR